ncbi:glycosyl hydrolase [Microbacterium deminutum]|uniref:glucan endo-1,3-beta-D-glucosidase n=1 Tax=Microbacterium deminutum TaxID=344164 RepID=A0ABP5BUX0_9MICO
MNPRLSSVRPGRAFFARVESRSTAVTVAVALVLSAVVVVGLPQRAGAVVLGAGSYTTTLPAGAMLPSGCGDLSTNPRAALTADAPKGPIPTNDWWTSILWKKNDCAFGEPLYADPAAYDTFPGGLGISYTTKPVVTGTATGVGEYKFPFARDVLVGIPGLDANRVMVEGWSDWTVSPQWSDGIRTLTATIGHGLPMSYFVASGGGAQLTTDGSPKIWSSNGSRIGFTIRGHDYVAYAPTGAGWRVNGGVITSSLAGKSYFTVAVLPTTASSTDAQRNVLADSYGRYAHAHVTTTAVAYRYDVASGSVKTTYRLGTVRREGKESGTVVSLYPHQWEALAAGSPIAHTYVSPRGRMKSLVGVTSFTTTQKFHGILPEVPAVATSTGNDRAQLDTLLSQVAGDPEGQQRADTYWTGKGLGRAARIAEIADQVGDAAVREKALTAMKRTLDDWLTASAGESDHLFYYDKNWGTLIGYEAAYGSDLELSDHHFHYGYFIAAAATVAKFDPTWASASQYGGMIDLLIRDANDYDRSDSRFPFLRDFDIYAGHDWASGHGSFASGNNQESSSEGMNFAGALIQWGQATGNAAVRDVGAYLYTTQAAAIEDYWFDVDDKIFPSAFPHSTVGMVWGDGGAYSTWFSDLPEMIHGINQLPITGSHLYLGLHPSYNKINYDEMVRNAGEPRAWQDILWEFLALGDADLALSKFRENPGFVSEAGESKAHTFHWIRDLAALGTVDAGLTADYPLAAAFVKDGRRTYVAASVSSTALTVTFSNGMRVRVPAGKTVATGAQNWSGGNAHGQPRPGPTPTPTPTPTPRPTPTPTPTRAPTPSPDGRLYLRADGTLGAAGTAGAITLPRANAELDGIPRNAVAFTASHLNLRRSDGTPTFDLFVDAAHAVGNATQLRLSYDLTGDGTWDRVETYRYFATDPNPGYEHYTQSSQLRSATGALGDLRNGRVKAEVWLALGNQPGTLGVGDTSVLLLPFS